MKELRVKIYCDRGRWNVDALNDASERMKQSFTSVSSMMTRLGQFLTVKAPAPVANSDDDQLGAN